MDETKNCVRLYICGHVCGTNVFRIYILPYLCVIQYFHMLYMWKDIATLESQKEVVCTTHLRNLKKEEKGYKRRRNQHEERKATA